MTRWFGPSWGAPVCDPSDHQTTPVGVSCSRCRTPIAPGDQGLVIASVSHVERDGSPIVADIVQHLQCFLEGIICPGCPRCRPKALDPSLN